MKKIFITILLAALMPFAAGAQDARQRTAETIVADALAQLPAQTPKAFDSLMQELAATGADGIRMMAAMLVPAAEGKNAPVEYAINGVVSYVTAAGREELAREIRAGLTDAVAASTDKPNQAFLLSQLQLCATAAEAPVFVKYAADEYLADYAVRGLISTPGTDGEILALIDASPAPDALLAYAAAEKRLAAAEPALLKWAADPKTGTPTKEAVYNALQPQRPTDTPSRKRTQRAPTSPCSHGSRQQETARPSPPPRPCAKPACRRTSGPQVWE